MLITIFALAILIASSLLVLGQLRDIAKDTVEAVSLAAVRARSAGHLIQRLSLFSLWALIFALSFY